MSLDELNLSAANALAKAIGRSVAGLAADHGATLFTGVCIRFRERFFVASATHGIRGVDDPRSLHILTAGRPLAPKAEGIIDAGYFKSGNMYDVGILELDPTFAETLRADWIEESQMGSAGAVPGRPICMIGFPGERAKQYGSPVRFSELRPLMLFSEVTKRDASDAVREQLVAGLDVLAEIPDQFLDMQGNATKPTEDLRGMSGSGVFLLPNTPKDRIWSPSQALLAGIQIGIFPESRFIKFQRVEFVLQCLEHFDDKHV